MKTLKSLIKKRKENGSYKIPWKKMIVYFYNTLLPYSSNPASLEQDQRFIESDINKRLKRSISFPWRKVGIGMLVFLFSLNTYAQLEAANWYFGDHAGLNFNSGTPIALTDGLLVQQEGCATISDENGNLLFYTDGIEVYDVNHNLMPNGTGLLGDDSSTQSAIIVPDPGNDNRYYIFTVDAQGGTDGLNYSVVNMGLNGGTGDVVATEKNIQLETTVAEKLTAVYHDNGTDIWVIAHGLGNNDFYSYKVSLSGVNTIPIISSIGQVNNFGVLNTGAIGYMKASPNGKKIAYGNITGSASLELFDFDNQTGIVSNPKILNSYSIYGVEFSPNSKIIYCTNVSLFGVGTILQYDITQPTLSAIQASETVIASASEYSALQLGIDGKMYAAQSGQSSLAVINNPNELGASCNFVDDAVSLSGKDSRLGLPPFITSYFQFEIAYEDLCSGNPTHFEIETRSDLAVTDWDFGDPSSGLDNTSSLESPAHTYASPGTYTVTVDLETALGYDITLTEEITILASPEANPANDLEACDGPPFDGFYSFDLTSQDSTILGSQSGTGYSVRYYTDQTDAQEDIKVITNPSSYQNTSNPQIIWARVDQSINDCYAITSFELEVVQPPILTSPSDYVLCDGDGDNQASFDLTSLTNQISTDQGLTFSYHASQNDAENNSASTITTPYQTGSTAVYVRAEYAASGCYDTVEAVLIVNPDPMLPVNVPNLEQCDNNADEQESFNLLDNEPAILANEPNLGDYVVTYYSSKTDLNNDKPIASVGNFQNASNPQTIYILVEDTNTSCTIESQFDLIVNPLPSFNTPDARIICDTGVSDGVADFDLSMATTQITGNDPNLEVLYYQAQSDAETGASNNEALNYTNTGSPYNQTLYVRLTDKTTACYRVLPLDLEVKDAPNAFTPGVYVYCDDDNDGEGTFYLPDLDAEITGGASGVSVSYHLTEPDANNNGVNPLPDTYNNDIDDNQTIYARVESPGVACYNVVEVELEVRASPQAVIAQNLAPLEECDDNQSGNAIFDLTEMRPLILANETTPSDFTLTYYASQADLTAGNDIGVPTAYPSTGLSQMIYVVVEGSNGCQDETSFELIVNPLPTVNPPSPLELCDVNNPGDEKEVFDLSDATLDITGGDTSIDVKYYASQSDATSDMRALPTSYENTVNNQSIYIRVEDTDTGCVVTEGFTLTLVVYPIPSPEFPDEPIEVCDVDNDGIAEFELGDLTSEILNGEPNVEITYHRTLSSANSGGNPIDVLEPFQISSVGSQKVYVRATNTTTDCYTTGEIELISVPTPEIGSLEDLYECDDDDDGFAVFDLTENTANILGSQNPADLNISYHISKRGAELGEDAIVVPSMYTNIVNNQIIYVRLENDDTKCIDVFDATSDNTFRLIVEPLPVIAEPTPLQLCDDDYNNDPLSQTIFDLTSKEGEITGQALPPNSYDFTYYASEGDYLAGNSIGNPAEYENVANPQDIYVEVVNTATTGMCSDFITMTIEVLPLPSPSITDPDELRLEECDDDNDGIAADPFDLTESGNKISGSENVDLSYYKTEKAAEDGNTSSPEYISNYRAYVNEPSYNTVNENGVTVQEIYVRVDSGAAGNFCYVIVPIEISVIRAPVLNLVDPDEFGYTLCEDGSSGQATLFLEDIAENLYDNTGTSPDTSTLIPLLDQGENEDLDLSNYTITYYGNAGDAETGTDPLSSGDLASDGDVLYIRVEYDDTGCYNTGAIGKVRITVEPRPAIQEIDISEVLCSDAQGGSTVTMDLTSYNDQINPGAPADTDVVYYANMDDYMTGDNIGSGELTAYTTVDNPQTIIAEVIDTNTLCESALFATITVEVDDRPVVDISGYSGIICEDSDPSTPTEGGNYDPILIDTGLPEGTYNFVWLLDGSVLSGVTGPRLEVTQAGSYTVEVTNDVTGCSSSSSATFTRSTPPEFTVAPLTLAFEEEHAVLITGGGGSGDYEFSVDNGPWISADGDGTLTIDGLSAGNHYVRGRDLNGCGVTVNTISFIDYPKFFTPNEDGYNDRWNIIGLGEENAGAKIYIFDRYGKLLKQLSPSAQGWDGTFNGKMMPSGDYWFLIEYLQLQPDGKMEKAEFKANFTLKR